ncbi:MAG: hypothetical protein IPK26_12885 [Planctomycetes bacterium]|nr:hypothetical protein [Planctomycetota bacterium]
MHRPLLTVLVLAAALPAQQPDPTLALAGNDPIALVQGTETPGRDDLTCVHGRYHYRFATADNLATFQKDPERHGIQWDGACARMGPRSGRGNADRWLLHDDRIWIFASDQCRAGFQKQPDKFFDPDVAAPEGTDEAKATARKALDLAIAALGGKEAFAARKTLAWSRSETNGDMRQERQLRVDFALGTRTDHDWIQKDQSWRYGQVLRGDDAFFLRGDKAEPMGAAARRDLQRELLHEPVLLLRRIDEPGVVAVAGERSKVGDDAVQLVTVWIDGLSITLGIADDGRIRSCSYRGRGSQLWFGAIELHYDDFGPHGLPRKVSGTFDGKPAAGLTWTWETIAVDEPLPAALFATAK